MRTQKGRDTVLYKKRLKKKSRLKKHDNQIQCVILNWILHQRKTSCEAHFWEIFEYSLNIMYFIYDKFGGHDMFIQGNALVIRRYMLKYLRQKY